MRLFLDEKIKNALLKTNYSQLSASIKRIWSSTVSHCAAYISVCQKSEGLYLKDAFKVSLR